MGDWPVQIQRVTVSVKTPNYIWLGVEECDAWNKIKTAEGSHNAGKIAASLKETLQVWNFETPKRVTDNAANEIIEFVLKQRSV